MNQPMTSSTAQPASQAALEAIVNSRFFARGCTDWLTHFQSRQNRLSDASRGMCTSLLPFQLVTIHNYRLSIILSIAMGSTRQSMLLLDNSVHTSQVHLWLCYPASRAWTGWLNLTSSGTQTELRQNRDGVLSSEWRGQPVGLSLDRASYNPMKKTRGPFCPGSPYTRPSFSAPASQLPCQDLSSQRATTLPCFLPASCRCCTVSRGSTRGAEQVTRSPLNTWIKEVIF